MTLHTTAHDPGERATRNTGVVHTTEEGPIDPEAAAAGWMVVETHRFVGSLATLQEVKELGFVALGMQEEDVARYPAATADRRRRIWLQTSDTGEAIAVTALLTPPNHLFVVGNYAQRPIAIGVDGETTPWLILIVEGAREATA